MQAVSSVPHAYTLQLRCKTHIIPLTGLNAFFFLSSHVYEFVRERCSRCGSRMCVNRSLRSLVILEGWRNSQVLMAADRGRSQY